MSAHELLAYVWIYPAAVAIIGIVFFTTTTDTSTLPLNDPNNDKRECIPNSQTA